MARILVAYSTVDGHTLKICERLRLCLETHGHAVTLASLSGGPLPGVESFDKVVVGASIRYGKHRREVYDFIRVNRRSLDDKPCAFFSVNVVARKRGKDLPDTNPYMRSFSRKTSWRPVLLAVFAGKIDYQRYGFLDRQLIRLIMWLTHGPTNPHACVEFTDWANVEAFGHRVSSI
jgi:menaquinone-dependent protoporphyrinogen oxidase